MQPDHDSPARIVAECAVLFLLSLALVVAVVALAGWVATW